MTTRISYRVVRHSPGYRDHVTKSCADHEECVAFIRENGEDAPEGSKFHVFEVRDKPLAVYSVQKEIKTTIKMKKETPKLNATV